MKKILSCAVVLLIASSLRADVAITERAATARQLSQTGRSRVVSTANAARHAAAVAANLAKREAKRKKRPAGPAAPLRSQRVQTNGVNTTRVVPNATGSISLIDSSGLQYFVNTDITFSTSSSASGAASEASYTAPIVASTSAGGTTTSTLNDAFDGYNSICVSLTNGTGPCATGNPAYTMYLQNGPSAFDATVPATLECTNRQVVQPAKTIGPLSVTRKIYVPTNDQYIRWLNSFTNTSGAPVTFTMITGNNLGSDSNTRVVSSSSGDAVAQPTDLWVSSFQNFSGNTSSDPRIGHVLQGSGAPTPLAGINFVDGDDNPFWRYSITLAPGETKSILNFATGQGSKAAANAKAAALALLPATSTQCLSNTELSRIVNFAVSSDLSIVKTASAPTVNAGQPFSYNLAVTNNGPASASTVSVTDVLPAGVVFNSATGTGWSCSQVAGTVTCTMASLAVGAANPITINLTAPSSGAALSNTATVASTTNDPTPGNNSSTANVTVVPVADLSITKTSSPVGSVNAGGNVTYTLQVNNAGPSAATTVSVSDPLPAGVTFVSATGTGWSCSQAAGTVTCTMVSLAVGAANPITITVTAPNTAATLSNTATVSSATGDPNAANNSSTNNVTVTSSANLSISKTTTATTAFGGTQISYTLAVSNLGPTVATSVSVADVLPAGSAFVSATGTGWSCSAVAGTVTCTRATLAVGAAPSIALVINAPSTTTPGTLVNTATVSSASPDPVPGNNSSTATVPLQPASAIPTMSSWMLMAMAALLGFAALRRL